MSRALEHAIPCASTGRARVCAAIQESLSLKARFAEEHPVSDEMADELRNLRGLVEHLAKDSAKLDQLGQDMAVTKSEVHALARSMESIVREFSYTGGSNPLPQRVSTLEHRVTAVEQDNVGRREFRGMLVTSVVSVLTAIIAAFVAWKN